MKKMLSIILALTLCLALTTGCGTDTPEATTSATKKENAENNTKVTKVINPLAETLDINTLDNCTVAVSLGKDDVKVSEDGKLVMNATVYSYELYDMVDIAELKEGDDITRQGKTIKVTKLERLNSGLVRINGGEENGGFDLNSNESTVYFEVGANDAKAYYELGKVELPVSDEFEYVDESDPDSEAKIYYAGDLLIDNSDIEYNFSPNNTSIVIENGTIIKMNKVYMP